MSRGKLKLPDENGLLECSLCKQLRSVNCFGMHKHAKAGRSSWCKDCISEKNKIRRKKNPELFREKLQKVTQKKLLADPNFHRKNLLKYKYDITFEQYEDMFTAQNGVCAACRMPEESRHQNGNIKRLAVDHNHETGEIRALLCHGCNLALGFLHEDLQKCLGLVEYIKKTIKQ